MVNWSTIDTVLLDMDGVLLDLSFDNWFWREHVPARYAADRGMSMDDAKEHVYPKMRSVRGTLDWYSVEYWSRTLGLDIVSLKQEAADRIRVRPLVLDFLDACRRSGNGVHLVTNAHPLTIEIKFVETDLEQYFDNVVSSHEFGAPKELVDFWERIHSHLGFDPQRSLFIDDNPDVLRAARDFGVGQLLSVRQPDSTLPESTVTGFRAIGSFAEIMPDADRPLS